MNSSHLRRLRVMVQWLAVILGLGCITACDGIQSALSDAGPRAAQITKLTWLMVVGGGFIAVFICSLIAIALYGPERWRTKISRENNILYGGIIFPIVTLTALLFYGFAILEAGDELQLDGEPVRIRVTGEQWWWRIQYVHEDGSVTDSANELRIPVGRVIELELASADVIHSFWVPAYAGKVDMIPGRINTLRFAADEPGVARGQCAEYCGGAHALMAFYAVAMEPEDYEKWLAREREPAVETAQSRGKQLFFGNGCGACHTIRGTEARGVLGPDLTHVGSRYSLGAGTLPNDAEAFAQWVGAHRQIKPDNLMPPYNFLSESDLAALGLYLESLE